MGNAGLGAGSPQIGILERDRIIAKPGFNRWLVPPSALASVFWLPLSRAVGITQPVACAGARFLTLLFSTTCDWKVRTSAGCSRCTSSFSARLPPSGAAGWSARGPRKAGVVAACLWCGGLLIGAMGVASHQLWMLLVGPGVMDGIGLGLGSISPASTLIKWFLDRRGMATGMAILGFGGGARIGAPLANALMNHFRTAASVGIWETFVGIPPLWSVWITLSKAFVLFS